MKDEKGQSVRPSAGSVAGCKGQQYFCCCSRVWPSDSGCGTLMVGVVVEYLSFCTLSNSIFFGAAPGNPVGDLGRRLVPY